jgi:hypothetical protein
MFLKFLDDLELQREEEAKLAGKKFKPAIEPPYRWRDWAINPQGITGDELLAFINNEETIRPDGRKGAGLFRYLRTLTSSNGDDRRDVIATVTSKMDISILPKSKRSKCSNLKQKNGSSSEVICCSQKAATGTNSVVEQSGEKKSPTAFIRITFFAFAFAGQTLSPSSFPNSLARPLGKRISKKRPSKQPTWLQSISGN